MESSTVVAQCKLVRCLSLEALTQLAEEAERQATSKFKVVAVKIRRGRGRPSPMLVVCTEGVWRALSGGAAAESPA